MTGMLSCAVFLLQFGNDQKVMILGSAVNE